MKPRPKRGFLAALFFLTGVCCMAASTLVSYEDFNPPSSFWQKVQELPRNRTEVPMDGGITLIVEYDRMETPERQVIVAEGNVHVVYDSLQMWTDRLEYHQETGEILLDGNVRFIDKLQHLNCLRARYNTKTKRGTFWEVSGLTEEEMIIRAARVEKFDTQSYRVEKGFITACEEALPKWNFNVSNGKLTMGKSVTAWNAFFKIKGVPILYVPWLRLPVNRRKRSSGFLMPSTGTSNSKGRTISDSFYLTMGRSADATLRLEYFSLRGYGYTTNFRARPNAQSHLNIFHFFVIDRERRGGSNFIADAELNTDRGLRGVVALNLVTNFAFRQNWSDTFRTATNPLDASVVFLTKSYGLDSFNFLYYRQETFFPAKSVLIRNAPVFSFNTAGKSLGKIPAYFFLDSSIEAVKRSDQFIDTTNLVHRYDFFPKISFPMMRWTGFSLTPRLGFRETFYSDRLDPNQRTGISKEHLNRDYLQFELDLASPALARIFYHRDGRSWFKHWIEGTLTYRRIAGIDRFAQIPRFDEKDIVTDTNELEYGLVNRVFIKQPGATNAGTREFLSLKISQQYFFDYRFGGALQGTTLPQIEAFTRLTAFSYGPNPRKYSPVVSVLRLTPNAGTSLDMRLDYDVLFHRIRAAGVSGFARHDRLFTAITFFVTRKLDAGSDQGSQLQAQIGYGDPTRGFSGSVIASYDLQRSLLLNTQARLNYGWNCCGVALEFQQFDTHLRNETQFRFSFSLKGLGHFGTLRRPESLF